MAKSMVVNKSRTISLGYGDLTLGGAELKEVKSLHILGVTLNSKLTFGTHLREVVSKAARSLWILHRAGKLYDYPRVLKRCFNAYVLPNFEHCGPV